MDTTRATATIAGHRTSFLLQHREGNDSPAVFTLTVSMPVSFEDLTATVWALTQRYGWTLEDLASDDIHSLIADTLVNNQDAVTDARYEIAQLTPGTPLWEHLVQVQMTVLRAYGKAPTADRPEPARLALVR